MRYEKKFRVTIAQNPLLAKLLRKFNLKIQYPDRNVSSIYYDTLDFQLYKDSIEGVFKRKKIRLRFYNKVFDKINLEKKIKIGDLGFKIIETLDSNQSFKEFYFRKINSIKESQKKRVLIPENIENVYFPVTSVNYLRRYYISNDKKIRLTIDNKISYSRVVRNKNIFFAINNIPEKLSVIELKFEDNNKINKQLLNSFTSLFNINLIRNSKYCNSIESLY